MPLSSGEQPIRFRDNRRETLARVIKDAINNGLPTSKSEWRHIIVDLAPVAVTPKVGIPLASMVAKRIPLENLERQALDKLLQEVGL